MAIAANLQGGAEAKDVGAFGSCVMGEIMRRPSFVGCTWWLI